jgi:hypothetical protein
MMNFNGFVTQVVESPLLTGEMRLRGTPNPPFITAQ